MVALFERVLLRCLEAICLALLLSLTGAVIYSTTMRYLGASPSWYDEIASVLLAWLTYFGATYALFLRQHMGFAGLVVALPFTGGRTLLDVVRTSGWVAGRIDALFGRRSDLYKTVTGD